MFAYACALDFAGDEHAAAAAYEQCPWDELGEDDRVRGQIQYAATLRNVGRLAEALRAITELRERHPHDPAPVVYESLIRVDMGGPVAAVQLLLTHILQTTTYDKLRRYRWALERYTAALSPDRSDPGLSRQREGSAMLSTNYVEATRIRLRKAHNADVDGLIETQTDRRVRQYLGGPRLEREVRDHLGAAGVRSVTAPAGSFIIANLVTDDMLGTVSLSRRGSDRPGHVSDSGGELELSYVLRPSAWGHGYATEAARALLRAAATELPDQPVLIVTQSANLPSLRVGERLGFRVMGTFEEFEAEQTLGVAQLRTFLAGEPDCL